MLINRRNFTKIIGISAAGAMVPKIAFGKSVPAYLKNGSRPKMKLTFKPYPLQMQHTFTVAEYSRNSTPDILTQIEYDGVVGYGEASMPPYLGESIQTATKFLSQVNLEQFSDPFLTDDILTYIDSIAVGNPAAKASVDIALHDLQGKLVNEPLYRLWGLNPEKTPDTDFTIGIDKPDVVRAKTEEALKMKQHLKILKVKLGRGNDQEMIDTVRSVTDLPLYVDVNQGWKDRNKALDMIYWLKEKGVLLVEQPMPKNQLDDMAWLTEYSPLPTMADEAFQRLPDIVDKIHGAYSGINIKLMKSTGLWEAKKMITVARALKMKVMIGCMTETSCGVSAVAQLAPLVDYADLDGNLLIKNDPFTGMKIVNGKVTLTNLPGIGIKKV
ncbi:dipeptide epimerase [Candidatus Sulfidibacterium hydrothermale]|uniref:dipeptide epimerase n=1 Tax=Candidatus Sulfidibacterium hydrothermale TaxID=2875962 RepID=UPI0021D3FEA3|nr:dipeptide epimerase [Candidatus Sulfidibacterium hydrothermale]